ncbi:MAG: LptF/LptG family permease [Phycisphaerales bacterium]
MIIDRYIARHYFTNIVLLLVLLFSFVIAVDVSINLSRFYKAAGETTRVAAGEPSALKQTILTALLIVWLWAPRLLLLFNYLLGLVLIGAMGFTVVQLVRHREVVAMLAGGVSLWRAARPIFIVAILMVGLQVLNQELVIPRIAHLLTRDPGSRSDQLADSFPVRVTRDGTGRLIAAARFRPGDAVLEDVHIWERNAQGRVVRRISAPSATFEGEDAGPGGSPDRETGRAGSWRLKDPRVTVFAFRAPARGDSDLDLPPDRIHSDLTPTTLLIGQFASFSQSLSWRQIIDVISTPGVRPEVVERLTRTGLARVSGSICTLLSLVICLPFFLTREPRNMVVQSLKCAPVAIITTIGAVLGAAAPIPGLPAAAAVFIPVVVLAPLAIAAATSMKS